MNLIASTNLRALLLDRDFFEDMIDEIEEIQYCLDKVESLITENGMPKYDFKLFGKRAIIRKI